MKAIVIGAAKPGYAESITRKLIQNGYSVVGTYDSEFVDNAEKLKKEFASDKLNLCQVDLASREELASFIKSVDGKIDGMVFAQFFFDMENPDNFDKLKNIMEEK